VTSFLLNGEGRRAAGRRPGDPRTRQAPRTAARSIVAAGLALAGAAALAATAGAAGGSAVVQLKAISARATARGASLIIESSEPAAYVANAPDPLTLDVDLRNVDGVGAVNRFVPSDGSPIAGVAVESSDVLGSPGSRVRISLAQPVAHRVRSDRNTIIVEFDRPSRGAAFVLPPASRAAARADDAPPRPDAFAALRQNQFRADALAAPAQAPNPAGQAPGPQAPVPAPASQAPVAGTQPERRFTGSPISLDFQGADLRAVLRTFSDVSGLNIVIDPAVQGTVDVSLRDVPWDQALDIILRANKLGYLVDGTIIRVAPLTVLADEEAQRRKLAEEQALAGQLRVITRTLSYAKAEELQAMLTKSVLSARGTIQVDPRTNTLIITDLAERIQNASDLITTLDVPQPQVEIEARIVQTTKNFARQLGIQWGFNGQVSPQLGNTTGLAFPNNGSLAGATGATQNVQPGQAVGGRAPNAVNLGAQGATSAVGLALGSINGAFNLDVALSAAESQGQVRLLSTPRVSTQSNMEAEIAQGEQIPYQTVSNNTVTTTFKDAALTLKVTPQVTAAGTVIMKISVDNGSRGRDVSTPTGTVPSINTQRANTTVLVNDGQTTVIGGIYKSSESMSQDRTPGLSRVPLLNWLFKRDTLSDENSELLIFITPRILKG